MKPVRSRQGNGQQDLQKRAPRQEKSSPAQLQGPPRPHQCSDECGTTWELLIGLIPAACTLLRAYHNFHAAFLLGASKGRQELITGVAQVVICLVFVVVAKIREVQRASVPQQPTFILPACPANSHICRDTVGIVIKSYVLLLDISLSYLYLAVFPAVAIAFIYALCVKLCPPAAAGCSSELPLNSGNNGRDDRTSTKGALKAMAAVPLLALLLMAQLKEDAANRFAISQFLLFLSTMLGALAYMMMRLPACGVALASELLHKAFLLLFLVTVHAVVAEALGEEAVIMACAQEILPVVIWFGIHLDRDSSSSALIVAKPRGNVLVVLGAGAAALLAYLATSIDEPGLSWCTKILVSSAVSGILTYYIVFMLRQWPGRQAGSEEAGRLLELWAKFLLISAAAALLLVYVVARRLGLQQPQIGDTLCRNFQQTMKFH